eukprot:6091789-Alexandrium_andersonii.AAC.1
MRAHSRLRPCAHPRNSAGSRRPISAISGLKTTERDARSALWTPCASGAGGRSAILPLVLPAPAGSRSQGPHSCRRSTVFPGPMRRS